MPDTITKAAERDFSTPIVEQCDPARFDNDGHLAGIGNDEALAVANATSVANESTAHTDAE